MKMNKEKYEELLLRFAKELNDVGVTDSLKKLVEDGYNRTPNVSGIEHIVTTRKVHYQHEGYTIEAAQTVKLMVKKSTP